MTRWLFSFGYVLLGLLAIGALLISSNHSESSASPSVASYRPSGASALAEFLRLRGYQVVEDRNVKPRLKTGDVVIAFQLTDGTEVKSSGPVDKSVASIHDQIKRGGVVFWLPVNEEFEAASEQDHIPLVLERLDDEQRSVDGKITESGLDGQNSGGINSRLTVLGSSPLGFITSQKIGEGFEISYADGIGLTNRFFDQAQNAQTFAEVLKGFAPKAKRIVFTGATFGDAQAPGFLETLGPWAEGSWYQFLFLLFIIVVSLNQRFGLPVRMRRAQVGGRELVDALADTMVRARATELSLESAYRRADTKVRSLARMPRDASEGERDRLLPEPVLASMARVKAASTMTKVHPGDALDLIVRLDKEVDEFAHSVSTSNLSRHRRKV